MSSGVYLFTGVRGCCHSLVKDGGWILSCIGCRLFLKALFSMKQTLPSPPNENQVTGEV